MAVFEVPLDPTVPAFTMFTDLDGETFRFYFRWNGRVETWVFDLYDPEGEAVQKGVPLVLNQDLLIQNANRNKYAGTLMGVGEVPDRFNLGTDIKLYYEGDS